ncbi:hypothetical protein EWP20_01895 [Neisseria meningitidis]|nr:hypothetical protein [Neisseria meningitidis]MBG8594486.1 hypothetical protein [Neisseria meningitidis]MBG8602679.1 hypothetical protein [Neisseria meningitidis]MBG8605774.1 hypothetical protein [Neisseria meningitidis]MBG8608850.1 hypothetical protein [Neisseria meningitidis]
MKIRTAARRQGKFIFHIHSPTPDIPIIQNGTQRHRRNFQTNPDSTAPKDKDSTAGNIQTDTRRHEKYPCQTTKYVPI